MSSLVRLSRDKGEIAIITIDNPPVNALSPGVPEGIASAIEEINNDPSVKAAVLIGAGRTFVAGADIKEFGKMTSGRARVPCTTLCMYGSCTSPVLRARPARRRFSSAHWHEQTSSSPPLLDFSRLTDAGIWTTIR